MKVSATIEAVRMSSEGSSDNESLVRLQHSPLEDKCEVNSIHNAVTPPTTFRD